jgi:dephospho-CoA kinase
MRVTLTGGIGSGKSTASALLAEQGAVIIDADRLAREVVVAGTPGFESVVATFGSDIVGPDGELDRPALAAVVFADDAQRLALNDIIHPLVSARMTELVEQAPPGAIIVNDTPLLVELGRAKEGFVIVVHAGLETRLQRLELRGLPRDQALARIAKQATDEQRLAVADEVLDNDGDLDSLRVQVAALWDRLVERSREEPDEAAAATS